MTVYQPAVPYPVIAPSDVERAATELMAKITTDGCEARAAQIKAKADLMFDKKSAPTVVPEFLARQNAAEQTTLHAAIDALQKRRPS